MEPDELPEDVRASFQRALEAGGAVHEPTVMTRVEAALRAVGHPCSAAPVGEPAFLGRAVVLMLDIDGVCHEQGASRIDDDGRLVGRDLFKWWPQLREVLCDYPDVQVVVHSSWGRFFGPLQFLKPLLPPDLAERVVDITDMDEPRRGAAVAAWLQSHAKHVGGYVVLDDDADAFASHVPLVVCDPQEGLSDPDKVEELRHALQAALEAVRARPSLAAVLAHMPNFGDDEDFARPVSD